MDRNNGRPLSNTGAHQPRGKFLTPALLRAIEAAILAPSNHNTQPWRFIVGESAILLCADRTRALAVVDPFDRELIISCGAALFNLRAALSQQGFGYAITLLPASLDPDILARVEVLNRPVPDPKLAALAQVIEARVTTRESFVAEVIAPRIVDTLRAAAEAEGVDLYCVSDKTRKTKLADLVAQADAMQLADPRFRRELASWVHPRRSREGMGALADSAPVLLDLTIPITASIARTFNAGKGVAAERERLVDGSPLLVGLSTAQDDPAAWLACGQALERVLLTGAQCELTASYLNQPIEVMALREQARDAIDAENHLQLLLRMGRHSPVSHTVRRPIDDVLT